MVEAEGENGRTHKVQQAFAPRKAAGQRGKAEGLRHPGRMGQSGMSQVLFVTFGSLILI